MAIVSKSILKNNIGQIRKRLNRGTKVCAVVKADAYGHGLCKTADILYKEADSFAVALIEEAAALRYSGIDKPILLLQPVKGEDIGSALKLGVSLTVQSANDILSLKRAARKLNLTCRIHFKINTGMNRLGVKDSGEFLKMLDLSDSPLIEVEGVYSHLSDAADRDFSDLQLNLFLSCCEKLKERYPSAVRHIAASGGILAGKKFHLDMVRPGLLLYGYKPEGFYDCDIAVKPALQIYAENLRTVEYDCGERLGYGNRASKENGKASLLRLGYADGFSRNSFSDIPMMMDCSYIKGEYKDKVLVLGKDRGADYYAEKEGTIPYEILCKVTKRSDFYYL